MNPAAMELTPEDDDLLSYFLSADVAAEQLTQPKIEPSYNGSAPSSEFAFAQSMGMVQDSRSFGSGSSLGGMSGGTTGNMGSMGNSFHPADMSMMRPPQDDDTVSTTASMSGLDSDEKRQRRLARNRESARQSRRRKKQYLELLEEKVSQLTESIDTTRAGHLERADESLNAVRTEILASLTEDLKSSSTEADVAEKIRQGVRLVQERFGPNSVERNAIKDYNFRQLDNLLLPPYCRFLLWLSVQDDMFYEEANGMGSKAVVDAGEKKKVPTIVKKDTLWQTLISDLTLTYEQDEKLKSLYKSGDSKSSKSERRRVALAVTYLSKLKNSLEVRAKEVQQQTDTIHSILTPEQSLNYLRWVDMNQDRLPSYIDRSVSLSQSGASESVQSILRKPDRELTVEDVTALLGELVWITNKCDQDPTVIMTRVLKELTASIKPWSLDAVIQALVEIKNMRSVQTALVRRGNPSDADVAAFHRWLASHADASRVQVKHVGEQGHGLVAVDELQQSDAFISIPYSIVLSADPSLGPASDQTQWEEVARDRLLAQFPSCMLALRVLSEACKPVTEKESSFFKPYLAVLPCDFDIPLFYDASDFEAIHETALFAPAMMLLCNSIKQFLYIDQLRSQRWSKCPIPADKWTLSNYFWALGVVLTRQNEVVVDASNKSALALIPGWDMCNHEPGDEITTFCDPAQRVVVCHAKRTFQPEEQVTMFYGPRTNEQLLVYSGFVPDANPFDRVCIRFKLDPLTHGLARLRQMHATRESSIDPLLSLEKVTTARLFVNPDGSLVSPAIVRTLQIACMTEKSLLKAMSGTSPFGTEELFEWTSKDRCLAKERYLHACDAAETELNTAIAKAEQASHGPLLQRFFRSQLPAVAAAKLNTGIFSA